MNGPEVFAALAAVRSGMEACLSQLEGGSIDDSEVGRGFDRVRQDFEALGDLSRLPALASEGDRLRLRRELEELLRLNALVTRAVARDQERLLGLLATARAGKRSLDALRSSVDAGGTCDLSA